MSRTNFDIVIKQMEGNKGAPGIDKMDTMQVSDFFIWYGKEIKDSVLNIVYKHIGYSIMSRIAYFPACVL